VEREEKSSFSKTEWKNRQGKGKMCGSDQKEKIFVESQGKNSTVMTSEVRKGYKARKEIKKGEGYREQKGGHSMPKSTGHKTKVNGSGIKSEFPHSFMQKK